MSHYTRAPEASCLPAVVIPLMCLDSCLDREPVSLDTSGVVTLVKDLLQVKGEDII